MQIAHNQCRTSSTSSINFPKKIKMINFYIYIRKKAITLKYTKIQQKTIIHVQILIIQNTYLKTIIHTTSWIAKTAQEARVREKPEYRRKNIFYFSQ